MANTKGITVAAIPLHLYKSLQPSGCSDPAWMRQRMAIVERPFAILKQIMGFRRFLCWGIESARSEMSQSVLSYNLNRMINREGVPALLATLR